MKRSLKKKSGVYAYLNSTKVLETGSDQDIANARKAYWKAYKAEWRRQHRKAHTQITISLTPSEVKQIHEAAKKYMRGRPRFIKEACFAYLDKRYLVPDQVALGTLRQLLAVNYIALQKLFDDNRLPYQVGIQLVEQMRELEHKVLVELYHPKEIV